MKKPLLSLTVFLVVLAGAAVLGASKGRADLQVHRACRIDGSCDKHTHEDCASIPVLCQKCTNWTQAWSQCTGVTIETTCDQNYPDNCGKLMLGVCLGSPLRCTMYVPFNAGCGLGRSCTQ